jgi:hypothetical protein
LPLLKASVAKLEACGISLCEWVAIVENVEQLKAIPDKK